MVSVALAHDGDLNHPLPLFGETGDAPMSNPPQSNGSGDGWADYAEHEFGRDLLALGQVRGIGIQAIRALLTFYGTPRHIWDGDAATTRDVLSRARIRGAETAALAIHAESGKLRNEAERRRRQLRENGVRIIGHVDPSFPERLADLPDGPMWLFVQGDVSMLTYAPLVAIVGTRDASRSGRMAAGRLASIVVEEGLGVISGLAEGIDQAAHDAAGKLRGRQVAVLGTGIDVVFPHNSSAMRQTILASGGAIISEYFPGTSYGKSNFVQRNRIQAGLSVAVCPVEGREKSGTAHTLRFAEQYGRRVFGVTSGMAAEDNEMVGILQRTGRPVFDLSLDDTLWELERLLKSFPGLRWPIPEGVDIDFIFRDVFASLDAVETQTALTPTLVSELIRRIERRYGLAVRSKEA